MRVENSFYYCENTKGETVAIPIDKMELIGRYFNEKELKKNYPDRWTFHYRIPEKLAVKNSIYFWGSTVSKHGYRTPDGVIITAVPVDTEEEVANVWNEINYFHNHVQCDTPKRGAALEYLA